MRQRATSHGPQHNTMRAPPTTLLLVVLCMLLSPWVRVSAVVKSPVRVASVLSNKVAAWPLTGRHKWQKSGYERWTWDGHNINYIDAGKDTDCAGKPPLLLIHGFGASAYHWRNNIPALSQKYHVYALDLLGFGFSDKPVIDYEVEVWRDQVLSFIREVINRDPSRTAPQPCVVAGNSLGGFTALYAAAAPEAANENLISGCILLNAACRFRPAVQLPQDRVVTPSWAKSWSSALQKLVINLSFVYTKRPSRIAQVLRQVYPVQPDQVDAELVESILMPALHPNAAEVFYRVVAKNGDGPPVYADDLLERLRVPLLLLWGSKDPWIRPQAADKIQALYPAAQRVDVDAGHCPHDEAPAEVNAAIDGFMQSLSASQ